ncbi:DUF4270 family protein [Panacibacter sp. DH6]|uniref:DUF4270 family protein n=1 Tax=Panacibacter microcysteis TaxID=2793269 RepID=A0A931E3Z0_9BACT|nr:DUF4270 family protein [Panacibacter microcysteis]MBG9374855.1 DUF4270 family protein [Panacibacter microcysteis]
MHACKKADINFGEALLDNTHTYVVKTDSVTVDVATVYIDSFITNNKATGLTGVYTDPYFGVVKAKSFIEIAPPAFADTFQLTTFDSLELVLFLNKTWYGDTTKPVALSVYRLAQNLAYAEGSYMYNTTGFATYNDPLAATDVLLRPIQADSISIRLSDELGKEWLSMLQQADEYVKAPSTFRNYFKGLCIKAGGTDGVVFGFKDSIAVRLHFSKKDIYPVSRYVQFDINNREYQFNNISTDRQGTAISTISSANNELSSGATNNTGYMQYITGTLVKLRFPYLRNLLQLNGFTALSAAELRIKPVAGSFNAVYPLPPTLRLSTTDGTNTFQSDITTSVSGTEEVQTGSLTIDELYGINTYYSYDVTAYINYLLGLSENNRNGLLIAPVSDDVATSFSRLLVQDNQAQSYRTELILYYLSVQ